MPPMNDSIYPHQKELFDLLKENFVQGNENWIKYYMDKICVSKSPAYDRMNGKKPITFDEGINWMIHKSELLPIISDTNIITDLNEAFLEKELQTFPKHSEFQLIYTIQDRPLLYTIHNSIILSFNDHMEDILSQSNTLQTDEPFSVNMGTKWELQKQDKHIKELRISNFFMNLPRIELWTNQMLDRQAYLIRYADNLNGFLNASEKTRVINNLFDIVNLLKINASSPTVSVYYNQLLPTSNKLILSTPHTSSSYFWLDSSNCIRQINQKNIVQQKKVITNFISHCSRIHPDNEPLFELFFTKLEERLNNILFGEADLINKSNLFSI